MRGVITRGHRLVSHMTSSSAVRGTDCHVGRTVTTLAPWKPCPILGVRIEYMRIEERIWVGGKLAAHHVLWLVVSHCDKGVAGIGIFGEQNMLCDAS